MRSRAVLVIAIVLVVSVLLSVLLFQQRLGSISPPNVVGPRSFQANDFLGSWMNSRYASSDITVSWISISENQGTYTIEVVQYCAYVQYGSCHDAPWGTAVLTINPPSAHAFYTLQLGSADLQLQLLNLTSMQVKESFQYQGSEGATGTTIVQTEQFTKLPTTFERIELESYDWTQAESLTLTLTNTGSLPVTFSQFNFVSYLASTGWFNGTKAPPESLVAGNCPAGSGQLKPGSTCWVTITTQGRLQVTCLPTNGSVKPIGGCGLEIWSTDGTFLGVFICVPGQTSASAQTMQSQQYATTTPTTTVETQVTTGATTTSSFFSYTNTISVTVTTTSYSTPASEKLVLRNYSWDTSSDMIWLRIGNTGNVPINLPQSSVFINGIPAPPPSSACGILNPGWNCGYSFTPPNGNWVVGTTYTLEIVTPEGVVFSFLIIAGGSSS